jgi:hypothetical protein
MLTHIFILEHPHTPVHSLQRHFPLLEGEKAVLNVSHFRLQGEQVCRFEGVDAN